MARTTSKHLKREAIVPLPASRRLSFVLGLSVLLVGFTATMDAFLWGLFDRPLAERRQAARDYELRTLRADYARLAAAHRQLQQRNSAAMASLVACEDRSTVPAFATPCTDEQIAVQDEGLVVCVDREQILERPRTPPPGEVISVELVEELPAPRAGDSEEEQ